MKPSLVSRVLLVVLLSGLAATLPAYAETPEELAAKIETKNAELERLEAEIAEYEKQLDTVSSARKTLEVEVQRLDLSRKKILTDIRVTENRIATANLKLDELTGEIGAKEKSIAAGRAAIEAALRSMSELSQVTLVEHFLVGGSLTDGLEEIDRFRDVQESLQSEIVTLIAVKDALAEDRDAVQKEEDELGSYKKQLSGQKVVLDENRKNQAAVLSETKNKESTYQDIIAEKKLQQQQFEQELRDYQGALQYLFDPSKLPAAGSGILGFPLDPTYMNRCAGKKGTYKNIYCITQYFGNTAFAQSGAYNGAGHNGIDFGAPEGTKIVSALSGTVEASGNTDAYKGCYSYGKWVLVRHGNGLMTLYAHLSAVSVVQGQSVGAGEFLGYSGKTGYATGPHLHFTVFASDGVKLVRLGDIKPKTNCANAIVPIAPTAAYLNPINYL